MSPTPPQLADVGVLIRSGALPEKSVPVCLAGDLVAEHEALSRQLHTAQDTDSLASPAGAVRAQMRELAERMAAATVEFRFRALPRRRFRELVAAHPPRRDDNGQLLTRDYLGVNYEEFFDALIRQSLVAPELDADTLTLLLDEKLTDRQFEDLTDACWNLNRSKVDVPFSPAASPSPTSSGSE